MNLCLAGDPSLDLDPDLEPALFLTLVIDRVFLSSIFPLEFCFCIEEGTWKNPFGLPALFARNSFSSSSSFIRSSSFSMISLPCSSNDPIFYIHFPDKSWASLIVSSISSRAILARYELADADLAEESFSANTLSFHYSYSSASYCFYFLAK